MAKIKLDDSTWREARFSRLCQAMQWERPMALGVLTLFWHATRRDDIVSATERTLMEYIPCDTAMRRLDAILALEAEGYMRRCEDGMLTIEGNDVHRALIQRFSEAGKAGQKITMERLRDKAMSRQDEVQPPPLKRRQRELFSDEAKGDRVRQIWDAYERGYRKRYDATPAFTDQIEGILRFYVDIAGEEAVEMMACFITRNEAEYRRCGHNVSLAVRDAEKLRRFVRAASPVAAAGRRCVGA